MLTITTSWDDGDVLDKKLADLLDRYRIKGTFYITKEYRKERLSEDEIRALSERHEVGAHTLTHPDLRMLSHQQKVDEMAGSKHWLEGVLGKEVPMFCYPSGHFDGDSKKAAAEAGFVGARTTQFGRLQLPSDKFEMPTTLQVYPMPFRKIDADRYWWSNLLEPLQERSSTMSDMGVPFWALRSFEALAKASFDVALKKGGVYHLWGHSWEIERYGLWEPFERVLRYIGDNPGCRYRSNGEILQ